MEKYFAFMKHPLTGKETFTRSWDNNAVSEWIDSHANLGYVLVKRG